MGSTHFFVEKSFFREVVEFEKGKFDSQQHLMSEAPSRREESRHVETVIGCNILNQFLEFGKCIETMEWGP